MVWHLIAFCFLLIAFYTSSFLTLSVFVFFETLQHKIKYDKQHFSVFSPRVQDLQHRVVLDN